MTINSDQEEKKNPGVFTKIWNFLFDDFHQTVIVLAIPLVIYGGYVFLPDEIVGILIGTVVATFVIGSFTDGELFKDIKGLAWIFNFIFLLVAILWYSASSIDKQTDTMDLKPYIKNITANKDNSIFKFEFILPFNEKFETGLYSSKFQPLFASKDHFSEFTITAVKTCYKYRFKSVSCNTTMYIKHPSTMESVYEYTMSNSVYPKKLSFEVEQEKKDME